MFEHLSEELIYEYLDNALPATQRAQIVSHLEICDKCTEKLAQTQGIFMALESLPEVELGRNLTAEVLAGLPPVPGSQPAGARSLRGVFLVQVLVALILLIIVWPTIAIQLPIGPAVWLVERARLVISQEMVDLSSRWQIIAGSIQNGFIGLGAAWEQFTDNTLWMQISILEIALVLAAVTVLWVLGNSLLLRPHRRNGQFTHLKRRNS